MVKQDHIPSVFFEHDFDSDHHDPFGLHAFYSTPIGPNFHSRRAEDHHTLHHPRPYIHQEPKDDIFALRGEPLPPQLQAPAAFRPELLFNSKVALPAFLAGQAVSATKKQPAAQQGGAAAAPAAPLSEDAAAATITNPSTISAAPQANDEQPSAANGEEGDAVVKIEPPASTSTPAAAEKQAAKKSPSQPKKRTRPVSACEGCRAKKVKCNLKPDLPICENCSAAGKPCLFRIDDLSPAFRAERFAAYGPPTEASRTIGQKSSRPIDEIPGESTSQRRLRRKKAREALLATGQRPPKAKAVFKSWANPNKLAAPCMPSFTFTAGVHGSQAMSAAATPASAAMPAPFHAFAAQMINASGVFHASASLPIASPTAGSMSIGSWDSSSNGFPQSFGALSATSVTSLPQHQGEGMALPIAGPMGSPHGSGSFSASSYLDSAMSSSDHQQANTPGLTDASADGLVMSPFSAGGSGMSPVAAINTPAGGSGVDGLKSLSALSPNNATDLAGSFGFPAAPSMVRPEMHVRRHTTAGPSTTAMPLPSPFGVPGTPMSGPGGYPFPSLGDIERASNGGMRGGEEGTPRQAFQGMMPFAQQHLHQHHRASTGNAFAMQGGDGGHMTGNAGGPEMGATGGTGALFSSLPHSNLTHPPPLLRRPQTASGGFLTDLEALTANGFPPREPFAEPTVPVDLSGLSASATATAAAAAGMGVDDFMGFEMMLA